MLSNQYSATLRALILLVVLQIIVIASSNYLVQIPLDIFGFRTTWGALSFPFVFLITDLTVRIFGKTDARKIIFFTMFPALLISYYFSVVFYEGQYVGHSDLMTFNLFVFRIVIASFCAYVIGQLLDIQVFDRLRQKSAWWVAPTASTLIGNSIDTVCFFSIAFYRSSDEYMATHWQEIAMVDYSFKILMSVIVFIPLYGILIKHVQEALMTKKHSIFVTQ